jgi:hypothetical protein
VQKGGLLRFARNDAVRRAISHGMVRISRNQDQP